MTKPDQNGPEPKKLTAIDVLAKVQKLLAQLNEDDRKRVIAFLNH